MNILVVGGGLAGLSAGIALARRGFTVSIVEASAAGQGASISITNRGVDALEALGILDVVLARSVTIEGEQSLFTAIRDGAGKVLPVPSPPPRTDTRLPAAVILLRRELMAIMRDGARDAGADMLTGTRLIGLDQQSDGVTAQFENGITTSHDLVVGADGLHSTTAHMASGGSLAIEDGVVLSEELAGNGNVAARLNRFTQRRVPRTTMVVEASVELLRLQQMGTPPAASAMVRAKAVTALRAAY